MTSTTFTLPSTTSRVMSRPLHGKRSTGDTQTMNTILALAQSKVKGLIQVAPPTHVVVDVPVLEKKRRRRDWEEIRVEDIVANRSGIEEMEDNNNNENSGGGDDDENTFLTGVPHLSLPKITSSTSATSSTSSLTNNNNGISPRTPPTPPLCLDSKLGGNEVVSLLCENEHLVAPVFHGGSATAQPIGLCSLLDCASFLHRALQSMKSSSPSAISPQHDTESVDISSEASVLVDLSGESPFISVDTTTCTLRKIVEQFAQGISALVVLDGGSTKEKKYQSILTPISVLSYILQHCDLGECENMSVTELGLVKTVSTTASIGSIEWTDCTVIQAISMLLGTSSSSNIATPSPSLTSIPLTHNGLLVDSLTLHDLRHIMSRHIRAEFYTTVYELKRMNVARNATATKMKIDGSIIDRHKFIPPDSGNRIPLRNKTLPLETKEDTMRATLTSSSGRSNGGTTQRRKSIEGQDDGAPSLSSVPSTASIRSISSDDHTTGPSLISPRSSRASRRTMPLNSLSSVLQGQLNSNAAPAGNTVRMLPVIPASRPTTVMSEQGESAFLTSLPSITSPLQSHQSSTASISSIVSPRRATMTSSRGVVGSARITVVSPPATSGLTSETDTRTPRTISRRNSLKGMNAGDGADAVNHLNQNATPDVSARRLKRATLPSNIAMVIPALNFSSTTSTSAQRLTPSPPSTSTSTSPRVPDTLPELRDAPSQLTTRQAAPILQMHTVNTSVIFASTTNLREVMEKIVNARSQILWRSDSRGMIDASLSTPDVFCLLLKQKS